MTVKIKFEAEGPLFKTKSIEPFLREGLANFLSKQKEVYKGLTPVRTGRLQAGWEDKVVNNYTAELYNEVPYGIYVFGRMNFVELTNAKAQRLLDEELSKQITKALGGRL